RFSLVEAGDRSAYAVGDDDEIPPAVRAFVVERDLAGLAAAFRGAQIDRGLTAIETTLGPAGAALVGEAGGLAHHAARARGASQPTLEPAGAALLGEAGGLEPHVVRPYAASNRLVITPEQLGERLPQADENTAGLFEKQCREVLDGRMARVGVAGQVRSRLRHERAEWPSMAEVAADLHLDVRTLRRRLTGEGTSFRRLLDEVRHGRALELLGQGATVSEVAAELGYAETATFTRSFTRWEGVPPSRAR